MDYTKVPRILIYKERSSLEDFGVYEPNTLNAALYESLMTTERLKPRYEGVFGEILRLFNDAYYYLTQIFLEKNPLERYARYCDEAGAFPLGHDFDWDSESREMVVKCMLFVMLRTFGENLPTPQMRLLTAMAADINESNSYQDMGTALRRLRGEEEDIAYKITCNFEFNIMPGSISQQDYTRRDIQELLDSDVSLKECLTAGKVLREAVNTLCKDKKQKLALIDRLLDPEKDGYGSLDIRITESYRSLYELRSELTGEPLPEKLPFERFADALGPPMIPTPQPLNYYQDEDDEEESSDDNISDDSANEIIAELREEVERLKEEKASTKSDDQLKSELNRIKAIHEDTLVALLKPAFYNIEDDTRDFLRRIQGLDNMGVASVARQFVKEKKIIPHHKKTFIWKILNAAKLYDATQQNWGQQMDIKD